MKWHDLRKNPDDLPDNNTDVTICNQNGTHLTVHYYNGFNCYAHQSEWRMHDVVAWTYFERFKL